MSRSPTARSASRMIAAMIPCARRSSSRPSSCARLRPRRRRALRGRPPRRARVRRRPPRARRRRGRARPGARRLRRTGRRRPRHLAQRRPRRHHRSPTRPSRDIDEPEAYEDAPLVVGGAVTGMLRIARRSPLTTEQRAPLLRDGHRRLEGHRAARCAAHARRSSSQERLLQSEKMSSVGQLVSGVAHELNNPLTGIMGFAQLLLLRGPRRDDAPAGRDDLRARPSAPRRSSRTC